MNHNIIELTVSAVKAIRQHADHVQRVLTNAQALLDAMAEAPVEIKEAGPLKLLKPATPPWEADDGKTLKEIPVPPKKGRKPKKAKRIYTKKSSYWAKPTKKRRKKK